MHTIKLTPVPELALLTVAQLRAAFDQAKDAEIRARTVAAKARAAGSAAAK